MENTSYVYYVISQRMLGDPHFIHELDENPRNAIQETLDEAGVTPEDYDLDALVNEFYEWKEEGKLKRVNKGYMQQFEPLAM